MPARLLRLAPPNCSTPAPAPVCAASRQAERFSHDMTALLHRAPGATAIDDRLRLARPDRIAATRSAAAGLAEGCTGSPLE